MMQYVHCLRSVYNQSTAISRQILPVDIEVEYFFDNSIPCPGCRFYIIIIIVTFYPSGCCQVENPEAPDFEKIASASGSFSTL